MKKFIETSFTLFFYLAVVSCVIAITSEIVLVVKCILNYVYYELKYYRSLELFEESKEEAITFFGKLHQILLFNLNFFTLYFIRKIFVSFSNHIDETPKKKLSYTAPCHNYHFNVACHGHDLQLPLLGYQQQFNEDLSETNCWSVNNELVNSTPEKNCNLERAKAMAQQELKKRRSTSNANESKSYLNYQQPYPQNYSAHDNQSNRHQQSCRANCDPNSRVSVKENKFVRPNNSESLFTSITEPKNNVLLVAKRNRNGSQENGTELQLQHDDSIVLV